MSGNTFCSAETISACLTILSTELSLMGFPKIVNDSENNVTLLVTLINTLWITIQTQKVKIQKINDQNEQIIKLQSDIKCFLQKIKHLEITYNNLLKEESKLKQVLNKVNVETDQSLKEIKEIKLENVKLNSALVTQRGLHEHDLRKRDDQLQNFQSHLLKLVTSDIKSSTPGFRKPASADCQDNCLHNSILNKCICQLDTNIQALLIENADVRSALLNLYSELVTLDKLSHSSISEEYLPEHLFQLPYLELVNKIESNAHLIVSNVKSHLSSNEQKL